MNQKSRTFKENGLLPPWKIVNSKYTTPLNDGLHNSVKAVQCLTVLMVCRYLVVGYFLSVNIFFLCSKWAWVGRIGAERAAGSRALHSASLVCKAGVAAVRGRVGTGRRLDTQTECFAPDRIQLHTHTHTHNQAQSFSVVFCLSLSIHPICLFSMPSFLSHILLSSPLSLSVQHAFLSVPHPAVFTSVKMSQYPSLAVTLQQCLLKKKDRPCLLWCTSTIILFTIKLPCHLFQPQLIWFSPSLSGTQRRLMNKKLKFRSWGKQRRMTCLSSNVQPRLERGKGMTSTIEVLLTGQHGLYRFKNDCSHFWASVAFPTLQNESSLVLA